MSGGELRHRITIKERVSTTDSRGFQSASWQDVCTVWAAAENLRGREFFAAAAVQAERTVKFTIRYREGIDPTMRIVFGDKTYNITGVDHGQYRKRYLEIRAMEVEPSGN